MSRIAVVERSKCHPVKCGGYLCAKVCPVNRGGKDCIVQGVDNKAQISEMLCIDCGICIKKCPFKAITIINLPHVLTQDPVYRYGVNKFELFRLPVPHEGKVVGLLGANGIGKTTALKLLSGELRPNLGKENDLSDKEVIAAFKGSELQGYFEESLKGKVKVSYKPQHIDKIPDRFSGKVEKLLLKFGAEAKIKDLAKRLGVIDVLKKDIGKLAGGELQKVAIIIAMLKEADLYFFDEPASYLDVKERIRVAKVIRELSEKKAVLVVEHDLLILDYLADLVHILFGQAGVYGVTSHPYSGKNGINTYLSGYLSDENVRFREEEIKFEVSVSDGKKLGETFVSYPGFGKQLGDFKLTVAESDIYKKEIVGVVGPNSIGKTTFMKVLAGLLKPDEGDVGLNLKIAYKPQYVKAESVGVMKVFLEVNKQALSQENKLLILRPLELEDLLEKNLDELSGGELQRVAIAVTLLQKADLYLFDEPSTYLDVEQRLQASRVIQKVIKSREAAALVIDHDLLFISYLSDRVLVFDGTPAKLGKAEEIKGVKEGMNFFLKELDITCRRDPETKRPRVNKHDSVKDREQRKSGVYFEI
jgi:ATP-binding cassette subfamily E protein 1